MLHIYKLRAIFDLDIVSLNTRGIAGYEKRRKVFNFLKKSRRTMASFLLRKLTAAKNAKMCGIISGVDQVLLDSHTEQVAARVCSLLFVNILIVKSLQSTPMTAVTI